MVKNLNYYLMKQNYWSTLQENAAMSKCDIHFNFFYLKNLIREFGENHAHLRPCRRWSEMRCLPRGLRGCTRMPSWVMQLFWESLFSTWWRWEEFKEWWAILSLNGADSRDGGTKWIFVIKLGGNRYSIWQWSDAFITWITVSHGLQTGILSLPCMGSYWWPRFFALHKKLWA